MGWFGHDPVSPSLYAFIDGGYLRKICEHGRCSNCDPQNLSNILAGKCGYFGGVRASLSRTIYFDAEPDDGEPPAELNGYWNAIELLPDTQLGFGWLRGKSSKRGPRQKAVDTLLAVEMVSGAYNRRYDVALLLACDADFVPVVNEVRRAGPHVVVAAITTVKELACSDDLRRAADRFIELPSDRASEQFTGYYRPIECSS